MKRLTVLLSGAVLCATLFPAANAFAGNINARQRHEQARIRQGIRSGELTRQEARKLGREQSRIRFAEARAKRDGELTPKERLRLQKRLSHASRDIYRQKHDNQDRN